MKPHRVSIGLFLLTLCFWMPSPSQTAEAPRTPRAVIYSIVLKDGSDIIGTITRETLDTLVVRTPSGVAMSIPRVQVKKMERLSGAVVQGEYLRRDPNRTRLLFAPTARPLKAGQGYVAFYEIFFSYLRGGDCRFSLGGRRDDPLPGASDQLFYVSPKLAVPLADEAVTLGIGAMYTNLFTSNFDGAGIWCPGLAQPALTGQRSRWEWGTVFTAETLPRNQSWCWAERHNCQTVRSSSQRTGFP